MADQHSAEMYGIVSPGASRDAISGPTAARVARSSSSGITLSGINTNEAPSLSASSASGAGSVLGQVAVVLSGGDPAGEEVEHEPEHGAVVARQLEHQRLRLDPREPLQQRVLADHPERRDEQVREPLIDRGARISASVIWARQRARLAYRERVEQRRRTRTGGNGHPPTRARLATSSIVRCLRPMLRRARAPRRGSAARARRPRSGPPGRTRARVRERSRLGGIGKLRWSARDARRRGRAGPCANARPAHPQLAGPGDPQRLRHHRRQPRGWFARVAGTVARRARQGRPNRSRAAGVSIPTPPSHNVRLAGTRAARQSDSGSGSGGGTSPWVALITRSTLAVRQLLGAHVVLK